MARLIRSAWKRAVPEPIRRATHLTAGATRSAARGAAARLSDWLQRGAIVHELAICAIFREEAPFLGEWLNFHRGVGVGHVFLYDNFSTDDFADVLKPWIKDGFVTLTPWPMAVGQLPAYQDCLDRFGPLCRWIAFIDIDEYLFAPGRLDILPLLRERRRLPGLEVYETFFGANGHRERPSGPLVEAFTRRAPVEVQTTVKTIANPRLVDQPGVHQFSYRAGAARDPDGRPVAFGGVGSVDALRINHYWSRSLTDLEVKVSRGDASSALTRDRDWHFAFEQRLNDVEDRSILPTAAAIRAGRDGGTLVPR